jgi:hypothetical protein
MRRSVRRAVLRRTASHHRSIEAQADVLLEIFPEAVAGWGGRDVLLRHDAVDRIFRLLKLMGGTAHGRPAGNRSLPSTSRTTPVNRFARTQSAGENVQQRDSPRARASDTSSPLLMRDELLRQFREAHAVVNGAYPTPVPIKLQSIAIAYGCVAVVGGLTIALPVVSLALYGSTLTQAIGIPLVSLAGSIATGLTTFLVCRWLLRSERRKRMKQPLDQLDRIVELLMHAFPEIERLGGRDAMLQRDRVEEIAMELMRLSLGTSGDTTV